MLHRTRAAAAAIVTALAAMPDLLAQCTTPQGNAHLFVSGLPRLGNPITVGLSGTPASPFAILVDTQAGLCPLPPPWQTMQLCMRCTAIPAISGRLPSGPFLVNLSIPPMTSLVGQELFFQGLVLDAATQNLAISTREQFRIAAAGVRTVYFDDFEAGQGLWSATNGLWQVGTPTVVGPANAYSGRACAGTNLSGRYPAHQDTTLLSPPVPLPSVMPGEELRLTYRVWFDTEVCCDGGVLWINGAAVAGTAVLRGWNHLWVQAGADLTPYAGQTVQLGWRFTSNQPGAEGDGVYVDDVHVFAGQPQLRPVESWESGIGDWWWTDDGVWEVGTPSAGCTPHSGTSCAATHLAGNYPAYTDSRLISPSIAITTQTLLAFWECFQTEVCCDGGQVQYSEMQASGWGAWTDLGGGISGQSAGWSQRVLPLPATLQGKTVRFAFRFISNQPGAEGPGWFIDDIRLL